MVTPSKDTISSEDRAKFEDFLVEMDLVLNEFLRDAAAAGLPLDYSLDSLANLEALIDSRLYGENSSRLENRAARYLGEVFRKNVGGAWALCVKHPKYLYFGLPVLTRHSEKLIEFCPIEVVKNFVVRKLPGLFRRAVDSHQSWVKDR